MCCLYTHTLLLVVPGSEPCVVHTRHSHKATLHTGPQTLRSLTFIHSSSVPEESRRTNTEKNPK